LIKQLGMVKPLSQAARTALVLMFATLARCNTFAATNQAVPESGPDPSYRNVIATHLKTAFKDYPSYEAFEISAPRWVHAFQGWSWLVCVRFQDRGRRRSYALFLDGSGGKVIDARFAVQTDECGTQAYTVFEQMGGAGLPPLY
jgi:hypothetical protein